MSASDSTNAPSLVGAHAQYVKGAAVEAIGNVTGAQDWQQSGQQDKSAGIDGMKAASANRDPNASGFGKVEEIAGKAVGCEGMENEGVASKKE